MNREQRRKNKVEKKEKEPKRQYSKREKTLIYTSRVLRIIPFICVLALCFIMNAFTRYVIVSESMAPTYHAGDMVFVSNLTPLSDIRTGDVVAYRDANGRVTIHRSKGFVTNDAGESYGLVAGDSNPYYDAERLTEATYAGKVMGAITGNSIKKTNLIIALVVYGLIFMEIGGWLIKLNLYCDNGTKKKKKGKLEMK